MVHARVVHRGMGPGPPLHCISHCTATVGPPGHCGTPLLATVGPLLATVGPCFRPFYRGFRPFSGNFRHFPVILGIFREMSGFARLADRTGPCWPEAPRERSTFG